MNFKDMLKLLNIRDDLAQGKINPSEALRQLPDDKFKLAFWAVADMFKSMKHEAERRGIWDDLTKKRET